MFPRNFFSVNHTCTYQKHYDGLISYPTAKFSNFLQFPWISILPSSNTFTSQKIHSFSFHISAFLKADFTKNPHPTNSNRSFFKISISHHYLSELCCLSVTILSFHLYFSIFSICRLFGTFLPSRGFNHSNFFSPDTPESQISNQPSPSITISVSSWYDRRGNVQVWLSFCIVSHFLFFCFSSRWNSIWYW